MDRPSTRPGGAGRHAGLLLTFLAAGRRAPARSRALLALRRALVVIGVVVGIGVPLARAATAGASGGARQSAPRSAPAPATLSCLGPHDLVVDGTRLTLNGKQTFERVCLENGAVLVGASLTLRAGALYVDPTSRIVADGAAGSLGYQSYYACSEGVPPDSPDGVAGGRLTILTRAAMVQGAISADGGHGAAPSRECTTAAGHGGHGGQIVVHTVSLTLTAPISATGGAGNAPSSALDEDYGAPAPGGAGGTISLLVGSALSPTVRSLLHVDGGASGDPATLPPAAPGSTMVSLLSATARASLPPAPGPLVRPLGPSPLRLPAQPAATVTRVMTCHAGDLDVGAGRRLALGGVRTYPHVCIHDGGVLLVRGALTLRARTILVDATSRIAADGVITATRGISPTGSYDDAGVSPVARTAHVGMPGASGSGGCYFTGAYECGPIVPHGGGGGGSIALIGRRILLAGALSASGAAGEDASYANTCGVHACETGSTGAGGGSGGGILVRADQLQLTGTIAITGGRGGRGYGEDTDGGTHGSPGHVVLLVDVLRAPDGPLPVAGPALVGHTVATDPVPPVASADARAGGSADSTVRGCTPNKLSLRDLAEMFLTRGFTFTHETVREWEARFTPLLTERLRTKRRGKAGVTWHCDETYVKVDGRWCYLYRAMDADGNLVDSLLSETRDRDAAKRFFQRAHTVVGHAPEKVTTDGHDAYPRAIRETLGPAVQHRTSQYMNNRMEQDH